jgi:hypothetical protein
VRNVDPGERVVREQDDEATRLRSLQSAPEAKRRNGTAVASSVDQHRVTMGRGGRHDQAMTLSLEPRKG